MGAARLGRLDGVEPAAPAGEWQFGREIHDAISKLAVVGDSLLAELIGKFSQPLYPKRARHFHASEMDAAWAWLAERETR